MTGPFIQLVGPNHNLQIGDVRLLGFDTINAHKLLFTVVLMAVLYLIGKGLTVIAHRFGGKRQKVAFWNGQGISLVLFLIAVIGLLSIWFDNPSRVATGDGLVGAGLAFAMQKVVTSFAGYFVILRGKTFNIGDRISMGGVRGDVISLNFIQTVIMEMGEPPAVQQDDPGIWVQSRQYSGRIVTISNAEIFESRSITSRATSPICGRRCRCPSRSRTTVTAPSRSFLRQSAVTPPTSQISPSRNSSA